MGKVEEMAFEQGHQGGIQVLLRQGRTLLTENTARERCRARVFRSPLPEMEGEGAGRETGKVVWEPHCNGPQATPSGCRQQGAIKGF